MPLSQTHEGRHSQAESTNAERCARPNALHRLITCDDRARANSACLRSCEQQLCLSATVELGLNNASCIHSAQRIFASDLRSRLAPPSQSAHRRGRVSAMVRVWKMRLAGHRGGGAVWLGTAARATKASGGPTCSVLSGSICRAHRRGSGAFLWLADAKAHSVCRGPSDML